MATQATRPTADAASPIPTLSTPATNETSTDAEGYRFEGQDVEFPDGSRWLIGKILSYVALQQTRSPCEARQVFTAIRTADPRGFYGDIEEAMIKVKFQSASRATVQRHKKALASYQNDLLYPDLHHDIWQAINQAKEDIHACSHAVIEPNEDTVHEGTALDRLVDMQCESAPHLFKLSESRVRPGMHKEGIPEGYLFMILMSKMPGARLPYNTFCAMSRAQRDKVREAFRQALTNVWACGVIPYDKALRSILWDEAEQKCYIVDFEDYRINDLDKEQPPEFSQKDYRYWDLDEGNVGGPTSMLGLDG